MPGSTPPAPRLDESERDQPSVEVPESRQSGVRTVAEVLAHEVGDVRISVQSSGTVDRFVADERLVRVLPALDDEALDAAEAQRGRYYLTDEDHAAIAKGDFLDVLGKVFDEDAKLIPPGTKPKRPR